MVVVHIFPFMTKVLFCLVVRGVYPPLVVRPLKKTFFFMFPRFMCVSYLSVVVGVVVVVVSAAESREED